MKLIAVPQKFRVIAVPDVIKSIDAHEHMRANGYVKLDVLDLDNWQEHFPSGSQNQYRINCNNLFVKEQKCYEWMRWGDNNTQHIRVIGHISKS